MSLIVLRAPGSHALHLPWVRATRPLVAGLDLSELFALVPVHGATADFLAPPPGSPLPDFAEELEAVRATPPDRVAAELAEVAGLPGPVAERIRGDPGAAISRLADTLAGVLGHRAGRALAADRRAAGGGRAVAVPAPGHGRGGGPVRGPARDHHLARTAG